jgi:hypothetical protein
VPSRPSVTCGRIDDEREKLMADLEVTGPVLATGLVERQARAWAPVVG